jgi:sugar/nucleoside kinase (ribokinase family)
VIQLVDHVPAPDEKLTAVRQTVAAGGPAANAAVTHRHLGGASTLLTGIGRHPLAAGITADLAACGVDVMDLDEESTVPPPVSCVLVTAGTGQRAVSSLNATGRQLPVPGDPPALVTGFQAVEFDGHHMPLALAVARAARSAGALTLLDGGSWKPGTAELLPWIDVAVCSADFRPPGAGDRLGFLREHGVGWAAVSQGAGPIHWAGPDGGGEVPVPRVRAADTLGAGDVLHGALVHFLPERADLGSEAFTRSLALAAEVATGSCASFGTRAWMGGEGGSCG